MNVFWSIVIVGIIDLLIIFKAIRYPDKRDTDRAILITTALIGTIPAMIFGIKQGPLYAFLIMFAALFISVAASD